MNSTEEKVIERVVRLMQEDAEITAYTQSHIYSSHISSIAEPLYPAISVFLLRSGTFFALPTMIDMSIQIDSWFLNSKHDFPDVMTVHRRIRSILNRTRLIDTTLGLNVGMIREISAGPLLYEEDTDLLHYPVEYQIVAGGDNG